ncbi:MAG: bifunctional hydroxymethylpyrimidine kinase/phosphomethylpyrimidine kinase [Chloroflexi bacterium]|nr:bifunctional hydroxymethylpyrimidine kinase/phosphomethylpyrimidine kinase [Chloroflexota bacterium]
MTIAGSDSGGGAGIQADLKTFQALGVYGASTLTAITAQNTLGVTAVHEVPTEVIAAQIDAVADDIGVDAAKTGMLSSAAIIATVAERIRHWGLNQLVVDPVMVATSGDRLLRDDAVATLIRELLPLALVLTPNHPEAETLVGRSLDSDADIREAAREIVGLGARTVLVKGGHRQGANAVDLLFDGHTFTVFESPRFDTPNTHGTGCTLSAAVAAGLAQGLSVVEAVGEAKRYVSEAIRRSQPLGHGHGPVAHDWLLSRQSLLA